MKADLEFVKKSSQKDEKETRHQVITKPFVVSSFFPDLFPLCGIERPLAHSLSTRFSEQCLTFPSSQPPINPFCRFHTRG
ncbi:hypothetical protein TNCT_715481 [Trichonephila clavata]|uniref:Uncharacterized protein n=1 Tax=Trichonephila clavata TaxID=2740835 RepID=A0A8X6LGZ4_TRICU|nr:hypothetical protein TNCT_715481 [Trichonephila clavata]